MDMIVDGVRAHVKREGKGRPVMLIHGLAASSYSWRYVLPELSKSFDVCAVDLPGFGRSDKPERFDYSLKGFADWTAKLMDQLGWKSASFAGNSMGGATSVRLALAEPSRVERLALLGCPVYPKNTPPMLMMLKWPLFGKVYEALLGEWLVRPIARTCFVDHSVITEEFVGEIAAPLKTAAGRRAIANFIRNAVPPDAAECVALYPSMKVPVLAIRGSHDAVVDRASVERFVTEWPGAKALHIESCGHAPQEERPDVINSALLDFFNGR